MEGACRNDKLLGEWTYYNNEGSIKKVIKADIKKELETEIKAEVQEQAEEHLEVKKAAAEKAAAECPEKKDRNTSSSSVATLSFSSRLSCWL